jgi:hypothetical protein
MDVLLTTNQTGQGGRRLAEPTLTQLHFDANPLPVESLQHKVDFLPGVVFTIVKAVRTRRFRIDAEIVIGLVACRS